MSKFSWILILLIIVAGAFFLVRSDNTPVQQEIVDTTPMQDTTIDDVPPQGEVKSFTVEGSQFKFSLNEIKVKRGDTVRITFKNVEGRHDWKLDEFNAATQILAAGQEETIEFTATETGTFEYYCSVGTHRQMGMKGNLIVE
jgi:plastocyanin